MVRRIATIKIVKKIAKTGDETASCACCGEILDEEAASSVRLEDAGRSDELDVPDVLEEDEEDEENARS